MQTVTWRNFIAASALVSLAAISACSQVGEVDRSQLPAENWPVVGGDWNNTRYSTLDQISTANIDKLGAVWTQELEGGPPIGEPIVLNGRMFITSTTMVHALDGASGEILWTYKLPRPVQGHYKGMTSGDGKIFVGLSNSYIVALEENTGAELWVGMIGDPGPGLEGQLIAAGPDYVDGLVISGLANGDFGARGRVVALDGETGKAVWRFDTAPYEGPGSETWPEDVDSWKPGGSGVWMNGAIDPELGLIYFGVGNPTPQWGGETREGDNLYSNSVIALDIKTGALRWHYQVTHHDIWEADLGTPAILYESVIDDEARDALAVFSTYGYLFQFDRATGEPIWPVEERPVPQHERQKTSPTQPFPIGGDNIGPDCTPEELIPPGFEAVCIYDVYDFDNPNVMYPLSATRAAPMAYSPETETFYAGGAIWPYWMRRYEDPRIFVADTSVPGTKQIGLLAAMHAPTNSLVYEHEVPFRNQQVGSGFVATAGGLLFHGETDGFFNAYEADSGEILWRFQTGGDVNKSAAIYEIDGEQHVAVSSSTGVWAFKLGGTVAEREAPPVPPEEFGFAGRIVPTNEVVVSPVIDYSGLDYVGQIDDEYAFEPRRVRVSVGDTVTWKNEGELEKTIADQDGSWSSRPIASGKTGSVTFREPGRYTYISKEYPFMIGELIVEE